MKTGHVIIGANYGDEGKGLMTDYLASQYSGCSTVIRYNGGAQAGHTVVTPDGRRHVFSHFGSGSFVGVPTHLSRFFIVNPMLFQKECAELLSKGVQPTVSIDSRAYLTTPFDMFVNQIVEQARGGSRHGSCGVGINETVTRCRRSSAFKTEAVDLLDLRKLRDKLMRLASSWLPQRLTEYKIDLRREDLQQFLSHVEPVVLSYLASAEVLLNRATISDERPAQPHLIFEGAQGLMLDEDRIDQWPHVTRSKTGLFNVLYLAKRYGIEKFNIIYASRTYLTRHGAGPLPGECDWAFPDNTNVTNQFQGHLRFAPLNQKQMQESIEMDLAQANRYLLQDNELKHRQLQLHASVALTCADQLAPPSRLTFGLPVEYISFGPTRLDICRQGGSQTIDARLHKELAPSLASA